MSSSSRRPRGTKPSLRSSSVLVTSSGMKTLDERLQDGLPVGAVVLVHNAFSEFSSDYSSLVHRYFLAEAQSCGHGVFCGAKDPQAILTSVPKMVVKQGGNHDHDEGEKNNEKKEPMRIAWRYNNMGSPKSEMGKNEHHTFDLQCTLGINELASLEGGCHTFMPKDSGKAYHQLKQALQEALEQGQYDLNAAHCPKNVLRISLTHLGGLLYSSGVESSTTKQSVRESHQELLKFLLTLRSLLRSHVGVALVSLAPSVLRGNEGILDRISECVDMVLSIRGFDKGSRESKLFREWHGFLEVEKSSVFNTLVSKHSTMEEKFVFRSSRKNFSLKPPHLPPGIQEEEEQEKIIHSSNTSKKHMGNIDF